MSVDALIPDVIVWGHEKGIVHENYGQALIQLNKTKEEVEELIVEIECALGIEGFDTSAIKLELGDVLVTLIIASACMQIHLGDCLQDAYDKISKRTGKVVDGIFVKDE